MVRNCVNKISKHVKRRNVQAISVHFCVGEPFVLIIWTDLIMYYNTYHVIFVYDYKNV